MARTGTASRGGSVIAAVSLVAGCTILRIAIDNFGVGFSSLSRISALDSDLIKLDRSFVEVVAAPDASTGLLAAIIDLAYPPRRGPAGRPPGHRRVGPAPRGHR